jgi:tetratricopeptide (TPR) repeat protein
MARDLIAILSLVLLATPVASAKVATDFGERQTAPDSPASFAVYEPERIRKFADSLVAQKEYFRASTEYMRLLNYAPDYPEAPAIRFAVAMCSYKAGRFDSAGEEFARLALNSSSTDYRDTCILYAAASRYRAGAFAEAHLLASRAQVASPQSQIRDRFAYLDGLSLMQSAEWKRAAAAFGEVPHCSVLLASAADLTTLAEKAARRPRRNPWVTAGLSALVPGLGSAACGYHWDALTALVLVGASAALAAEGHRRDNPSAEAGGLVLSCLFYSANIYGGAGAARRYNAAAVRRVRERADALSTLSLD